MIFYFDKQQITLFVNKNQHQDLRNNIKDKKHEKKDIIYYLSKYELISNYFVYPSWFYVNKHYRKYTT